MAFIPLHVYSGFSYLQSALEVNKLPFLAKKYGYSSIALTDKGTMSGYAPFAHRSLEAGITPIFGMDIAYGEETFSLYVKNEEGYRNLLPLTLLISEEKLSLEDIQKHADGLLLVYSPNPLVFAKLNPEEEKKYAFDLAQKIKNFSEIYLALPYWTENKEYVDKIRNFSKKYSYKTVAFPFLRYEKKADAIALEILSAVQKNINLVIKEKSGNECFLSNEEISSFYSEEEIDRTEEIKDACKDFVFFQKRGGLLHFPNSLGLSSEEYLAKCAKEGLAKRLPNYDENYEKRLNYELDVINRMGYADYFLLVSDYVNYAKNNGITVGPGRGSGAGSLVSYSLGIVELDPIRYNLIFERFLNPERQSMPDIDVDFADISRERVVTYLQKKWGKDRIGHVLTTQTILAKQALRDVGRIYGYDDKKEVSLLIDAMLYPYHSLRFNYVHSPKFKSIIDGDKYFLTLVSLASKIEGLPRQAGLHAAGIVINDKPLYEVLPTTNNNEVGFVACLEKDFLEEQGFLKMDLLGLRNLTIIDECLALIRKYEGVTLSPYTLPYTDPKAIQIIQDGKEMGLFQLESLGMKRAIKEVQPTSFEDVAALLALFRPGPMDSIPSYARRKAGLERITYLSKELEPILKDTYGIIVYQEQIMQIVREMAGFSFGQADLFRRAISKKNVDKLESLKGSFIQGCIQNGKDEALARKVYDLILRFANYGFNKSHAFSYAVLTCQMAYLKVHYPKEFFCSILDSLSPGDSKFANTLSELKEMHISLSVPDINFSEMGFVIDKSNLRFPLSLIKGLQSKFLSSIIDERMMNGKYEDIFDFAARTKKYGLNLQILVKLIDAGCFDSLCPSRESLRASAYAAMEYAEMLFGTDGQQFLMEIGISKPVLENVLDDKGINLQREYDALGMMVSDSPLSLYEDVLKKENAISLADMEEKNGSIISAGVIKSIRAINTKRGKKMAFMQLYDANSEREFVLFSDAFEKNYPILKNDAVILFRAHKDTRKNGSFIIDDVRLLGGNV